MKHITVTADSPLREIFAANIRRLRLAQGLELGDVVARAGRFDASHLSHMERNRTSPTLETVEWVAAALGVSPSSLLVFRPGGGS
jgi:transcriptional regulator with XRE-family HTH domain